MGLAMGGASRSKICAAPFALNHPFSPPRELPSRLPKPGPSLALAQRVRPDMRRGPAFHAAPVTRANGSPMQGLYALQPAWLACLDAPLRQERARPAARALASGELSNALCHPLPRLPKLHLARRRY